MEKRKIVQALKDGAILGAAWGDVEEMLGAINPDHVLHCTLYENSGNFVPNPRAEFDVRECELSDILTEAGVNWMSDDYPPDKGFIAPAVARFFAVQEPNRVRWMQRPK